MEVLLAYIATMGLGLAQSILIYLSIPQALEPILGRNHLAIYE